MHSTKYIYLIYLPEDGGVIEAQIQDVKNRG